MLEIEVCEIRGKCPVYKVGDRIVIDDPEIIKNSPIVREWERLRFSSRFEFLVY